MNTKLPIEGILQFHRTPFFIRNDINWKWDVTVSGHYKLWMVIDGHGKFVCNGTTYEAVRGQCHIFCPGDKILADYLTAGPLTTFSIHFIPKPCVPAAKLAMHGIQLRDPQLIFDMARIVVEAANRNTPCDRQLCLTMSYAVLSLAWSDQFRPAPQSATERIHRLTEDIRNHPGLERSNADMAKECGLSISQFGRTFKGVTHMSPNAFVLRCRIEQASLMLKESSLTIGEIAETLGYQDIFYFSRQFKKLTGKSPSACRKEEDQ